MAAKASRAVPSAAVTILCLAKDESNMPIRQWVVVSTLSLGLLGALFAAPVRANSKAKDASEAAVPAPPLPAIESIQVEPAALTLENARDARLVLVWGVTKDGKRFDLT